MSSKNNTTVDETTPLAEGTFGWRVVDIVVAAVLGVAVGLLFIFWNFVVSPALWEPIDAVLPGLGGLIVFGWLLGGPLGGIIIRKPGAALLTESLAAVVSMVPGNKWGWTTLYSGLAQGMGAELVLLSVAYRRWSLRSSVIAGMGAGVGAWAYEYVSGNYAKTPVFNVTYLVCLAVSGTIAGVLAWYLMKALASSGALNRFQAGREAHTQA